MSELAFNQLKVICENPICKYYQIKRTASFPLVGGDLYLSGTILCACGLAPRLFERGERSYG